MQPTLLVVSSDKYEAYWNHFYGLLNAHDSKSGWHKIYHLTETKKIKEEGVVTIQSNTPVSPNFWSENLLMALKKMEADYFVLLLEDFFLNNRIDFNRLHSHFQFIENHPEVGCIRLCMSPGGDIPSHIEGYSEHSSKQPFQISTQAAIWKKTYLENLIKKGEHPWDFEICGSQRAAKLPEKVFVVQEEKPFCISYFNGVIQGKLTQRAKKHLELNNLIVDTQKTPVNSNIEEFYWNTKQTWIRKTIDFINYRIIRVK